MVELSCVLDNSFRHEFEKIFNFSDNISSIKIFRKPFKCSYSMDILCLKQKTFQIGKFEKAS